MPRVSTPRWAAWKESVTAAGCKSAKEMVVEVGSFLALRRAEVRAIVASRPPRRKRLGERDSPVTVSGGPGPGAIPGPPSAGVVNVTGAPLLDPCALVATSVKV